MLFLSTAHEKGENSETSAHPVFSSSFETMRLGNVPSSNIHSSPPLLQRPKYSLTQIAEYAIRILVRFMPTIFFRLPKNGSAAGMSYFPES